MTIPQEKWRAFLVSRAARESAFGAGATVDRRVLVHAAPTRPMAFASSARPLLDGPERHAEPSATWYESAWTWDAVRPDDLAWALSYALGPGTYATVDGTGKRHTITPEAAGELLSFSVEESVAVGWQDRYTGGVFRRLRLSAGTAARGTNPFGVEMEGDLLFSGRTTGTGAGATVGGEPVWRFGQSRLWIGSAYGGTDTLGQTNLADADELTAQWKGFRASFDNRTDVKRMIDFAGNTMTRAERGERRYELGTSLDIADRTLLDDLASGTIHAVEIGWASGVLAGATSQQFGIHLIWPKARIAETILRDGADGRLAADIAWHILSDATHGPLIGIVWNQTAPYAA